MFFLQIRRQNTLFNLHRTFYDNLLAHDWRTFAAVFGVVAAQRVCARAFCPAAAALAASGLKGFTRRNVYEHFFRGNSAAAVAAVAAVTARKDRVAFADDVNFTCGNCAAAVAPISAVTALVDINTEQTFLSLSARAAVRLIAYTTVIFYYTPLNLSTF